MTSVVYAKIISEKNINHRDILEPTVFPAIIGDGSIDLKCGYCGTTLIKHARPNLAICNTIIRCPNCQFYNDTLDMQPG